ncbi:hypothetical protein HVV49_15380 [Citrobacter freundii]|uniref:DUF6056 family protein n=1 Tax=Escherichia coli TaxID=562 RepID=UPI0014136D3E|nr:DUF6056 family protein [Escherichia coli]MBA8562153.1 hypothetical protein [Citrobacter freundii]NHX17224.1 hypothetical protein [Escherichia coli]UTO48113.1 DUF6056 family protein [Escherichia coli]
MIKIDYRYIFLFVAFLLVLVIQYLSPMQSDDYSYFLKGVNIQNTINHYMGWSGRLVADFISSAILKLNSKILIAMICTLAVISLFVLISSIPNGCISVSKLNIATLSIISLLYWVDNPALGQTTFWVVGAANYLWTAIIYLPCMLLIHRRMILGKDDNVILLAVSSLLAGMTNENIGITLVVLVAFCFLYTKISSGMFDKRLALMCLFIAFGSSILLLAPGNFIRATYFQDWYNLPLSRRVFIHFFERIPAALLEFKFTLALIALFSFITENKKRLIIPFIIFCCGIFSLVVLVASPGVGERNINGTFILFLLSLAYTMNETKDSIHFKKILTPAIGLLSIIFCISYYYIFNTYSSLNLQEKIRTSIITSGINHIPQFYVGDLYKKADGIDSYFNGVAMGLYYGTTPIKSDLVFFDYASVIFGNAKKINHNNSKLIKDVFYESGKLVFSFNENHAHEMARTDSEIYFMHLTGSNGESINGDFSSPITCIYGTCYIASQNVGLGLNDIKDISFGKYNFKTQDSITIM